MTKLDRRAFGQYSLGSLLTFSLLETVFSGDAFAAAVKPIANRWLAELNDLSRDLRGRELSQVQWQEMVENLYAQIDLPQMLEFIDFDQLAATLPLVENGATRYRVPFPKVEGVPSELVFGRQIFGLKEGRSVVPHGHNNMATAFLILKGTCHGRHYDRLEDEADHLIIKPTIDRSFSVGEYSTVSDRKDNVHWFKATTEGSYIFNIHVTHLRDDFEGPNGRVYVDPHGESISGGKVRARKIGYKEAHQLYG